MAAKIRLQRGGAKHAPVYRMVVADSRKPRDGRFIEALGVYHPKARGQTKELELKLDRIDYWLSVGAEFSDTARSLVKRARSVGQDGVVEATPQPAKPIKKQEKPKAEKEAKKEEPVAEADTEAAAKDQDLPADTDQDQEEKAEDKASPES